QHQHPTEIACTNRNHEKHQRPATPHAERAVTDTKHECLCMFAAAVPMSGNEAKGRTALVQAPVLERTKLIQTGKQQDTRSERPWPALNPAQVIGRTRNS